jgi:hypothetical protein
MFPIGFLLKVDLEYREMAVKSLQLDVLRIQESIIEPPFHHHIRGKEFVFIFLTSDRRGK